MSKNLKMLLGGGVVLVLAAGAYFMMGTSGDAAPASTPRPRPAATASAPQVTPDAPTRDLPTSSTSDGSGRMQASASADEAVEELDDKPRKKKRSARQTRRTPRNRKDKDEEVDIDIAPPTEGKKKPSFAR